MHNRGFTIFRLKIVCLTVPKIFVEESYCFWENFWFRKVFTDEKRGAYLIFLRKKNGLAVQKKFVSLPAMFQKICGIGEIYACRCITLISPKLFVSQCRKLSWESLQCFEKFRVSKKFMHITGYHVFPSEILCLTVPEIFVGIPSMFQKNSGIEKKYA